MRATSSPQNTRAPVRILIRENGAGSLRVLMKGSIPPVTACCQESAELVLHQRGALAVRARGRRAGAGHRQESPESVSDSLCAGTFSCPFPDVYPVSFLRAI